MDELSFSEYSRKLVDSNDPQVARQAILVLGDVGNPNDMVVLERLATMGNANHFRPAMVALAVNCSTTEATIWALGSIQNEPWRKELIVKTWQQAQHTRMCARG